MWWLSSALAQQPLPDLDAQHFRPSVDGDGLLWTDDAGRREERVLHARALLGYVDQPLVRLDDGVDLVRDAWTLDLLGGVQQGRVRVGLRIPVVLLARSDVAPDDAGLGDVQVDGKLSLTGSLAATCRLTAPTATLDLPLASSRGRLELAVVGSRRFGDWLVAANVGLAGPEGRLVARAALGWGSEDAGLALELAGDPPLAGDGPGPWELLGEGHAKLGPGLILHGGIGAGLSSAVGSPALRLVVGVGYDSSTATPTTPR
jgi:hypothetical protein